jgi:hypothetical protein
MIDNLKIGAINYAVTTVGDLHTTDVDGRKCLLNGHILHSEAQIKVDAVLSEDMKIATLWHEALHGILAVAGHDNEPESLIIPLGYGLVALLRDNPELVKLTIGE